MVSFISPRSYKTTMHYSSSPGYTNNPTSLLLILSATVFFVGITEFMLSSMLAPLAVAFQTTSTGASWLISSYAFSYALAAPILGYFSNRVNRGKLLLSALLLFAFDGLSLTLAPSLDIAIVLRIIGGMASAIIIPTVFALISDVIPSSRQTSAMGFTLLGMTFGIAFGPAIAGILNDLMTWRAPFIFCTLGCLATFFAGIYHIPCKMHTPSSSHQELQWLCQWAVLRPLIAKGAWNGTGVAAFLLSGEVLRQRYGFGPAEVGLTVVAFGVGLGLGNISAGRLHHYCRRGEVIVLSVCLLLSTMISLFMLAPLTLPVSLVCLVLWGTALGVGAPCSTLILINRAGNNKGVILAFAETFNNIGILGIVPLASFLLTERSPQAAMGVFAIGLFIGLTASVIDCWVTRPRNPPASPDKRCE